MKDRSALIALMAIASISNADQHSLTPMGMDGPNLNPVIKLPKEPIPPNGTKTYFFNTQGEFSTEQMLKAECVFKCFAINDKNALRKFNKWKDDMVKEFNQYKSNL